MKRLIKDIKKFIDENPYNNKDYINNPKFEVGETIKLSNTEIKAIVELITKSGYYIIKKDYAVTYEELKKEDNHISPHTRYLAHKLHYDLLGRSVINTKLIVKI
jgi:hypothetical protein